MISLYFHIPFCSKKCPYCHFYVIPNKAAYHPLLAEGLEREWQMRLPQTGKAPIQSIYFGGGTPSLFGPAQIGQVLQRIGNRAPDCEITLEANPEEIDEARLCLFREVGINRLSLGVQSLDDRSLQTLERIHTASKAKEAIFAAKQAGFDNISIDLMYDLPGQTEASWRYTLDQIGDLPITHLSLYNLTIEPHTPFDRRKATLLPLIPPPELSLKLLQSAVEELEKKGLHRYEISAFAKAGCESKHNVGYWIGRPFLGFGPSAFSFWEGSRFRNTPNLNKYTKLLNEGKFPVDFKEKLPYPANVNEQLAVELRLIRGVDLSKWELPEETLITLDRLEKGGLLEKSPTGYRLSERGLLVYDSVAEDIISYDVRVSEAENRT